QRLEGRPGAGERRGVRRMRVDDRLHVRALAIDPDMEPHARVRAPLAIHGSQVGVDEHHALGRRFLEAVAELQRPPGVGPVAARGDLSREPGLVSLRRQDPAGERERLAVREADAGEVLLHLPAYALHEVRLVPGLRGGMVHRMRFGRKSESAGKSRMTVMRTMSATMKGITPRKTVPVDTDGNRVFRTKRFIPTGGLMRPISTTTTIRMPNQTGSNPSCRMTGRNTGMVSSTMESSSMAVPSST